MRFALIDNIKSEAKSGLKGVCPCCAQPVIAKCGDIKVHHWAHARNQMCDKWWESETEWHRNWKSYFPVEWQEVIHIDESNGEKHIADVKTSYGNVIEFQHSHINPEERLSRELFYQNLVWIVDGTRLKRDWPRFLKGKKGFQVVKEGIFKVFCPEEIFPVNWLSSKVPVIFDFLGLEKSSVDNDQRNYLICLLPAKIGGSSIVTQFSRKAFLKNALNGEWNPRINKLISDINQVRLEVEKQKEHIERLKMNAAFNRIAQIRTNKRRRW